MRSLIHKLILWYTVKICGGAFHTGSYGDKGHYIRAFTDEEYERIQRAKW